jgi:two-component system chemotaxis sensor kinase CheA
MSVDELQEFISESRELIGAAEQALLSLEAGGSFASGYDAIFRAFHSIKGMAGMLELEPLQAHVHQLESLLVPLKGAEGLSKGHVDLFLRGCDATLQLLKGDQVTFDYAVGTADLGKMAALPPAPPVPPGSADAWRRIGDLVARACAVPTSVARPQDPDAQDFLAESDDALQRVSATLLKVEKGVEVGAEWIDTVYRDVHTVKGGAQLFGIKGLAEAADVLETALEPVRQEHLSLQPAEVDALIEATGCMSNLVAVLRGHGPAANAAERAALPTAAPPPAPMVTASPPAPSPVAAPAPSPTAAAVPTSVAAAHPAASPEVAAETSVRVPVSLLDRMMASMGEMVLVRNQVLQFASKSDDFEFLRLSQRLDIVTSEIQGEVMKTRMQPVANVLDKFQRIVRDLSHSLGKRIDLVLLGTSTELDKTLLEAVKDPLMHIVRNSCDHGIETPEQRRLIGKSPVGKVTVRSYQEGGQVVIEVNDDGRGLNRDALLRKAVEKNLVTPERAFSMDDREVFQLIFAPGFSTADQVTNISGRGVGMDVVKSNIERIGGVVDLESQLHHGMTLRLKIPLTLAILPAMILRLDEERYAIAQVKVVELLRIEANGANPARVDVLQGQPFYRMRGTLLPLLSLKAILGMPHMAPHEQLAAGEAITIVVVRHDTYMFGITVDEVQDKADIVLKPLSNFLKAVTSYGGATVLGDGSIALILDIGGIASRHALAPELLAQVTESEEPQYADESSEAQELLLFCLNGRKERYAVPLTLVHRLEELPTALIETSGDQRLMRYRGGLLPILSLGQLLGLHTPAAVEAALQGETVKLLVVKKHDTLYGFIVDEILDVWVTDARMEDRAADRVTILGNMMTPEGLVVVVDILRVVDEGLRLLHLVGQEQVLPEKVDRTHSGPIRILFAEDTIYFRKHVRGVLERAGFTVDVSPNGQEALSRLQGAPPNHYQLLLSDIEMPVMDGLQLIKSVRAHASLHGLPAVALSTRFNPRSVEEGKGAGFNEYLEKMNAEVLVATLHRLLTKQVGVEAVG